ncbi:MAG: hypothetical protein GY757_44155 [bacterium]|nr:hypothetical protein [bacterium]
MIGAQNKQKENAIFYLFLTTLMLTALLTIFLALTAGLLYASPTEPDSYERIKQQHEQAIVLAREGKFDDSLDLLEGLREEYPFNRAI